MSREDNLDRHQAEQTERPVERSADFLGSAIFLHEVVLDELVHLLGEHRDPSGGE